MKLSAIVITKNAASTIRRCLDSVAFADERIVVDAESSDGTATLAEQQGARVYVRLWPGYGAQKNFGAEQAHGDWLLFIDADEEIQLPLVQEILRTISATTVDFLWLRIVTVFLGRPLVHLYGHNPRLFKRTAGRWTDAAVHEQVEDAARHVVRLGDERSQVLQEPLQHYSHDSVTSYLAKMDRYTSLEAREMHASGQHRHGRAVRAVWWLPWWLAARLFLKMYFYRGGWRDARAGLVWCALSAYYEFTMGKKFLKLV